MKRLLLNVNGRGVLDYVTVWYILLPLNILQQYQSKKKIRYKTKSAFVSTNSISQGRAGGRFGMNCLTLTINKIHFVHRTF